jgi:hypothetical protein
MLVSLVSSHGLRLFDGPGVCLSAVLYAEWKVDRRTVHIGGRGFVTVLARSGDHPGDNVSELEDPCKILFRSCALVECISGV